VTNVEDPSKYAVFSPYGGGVTQPYGATYKYTIPTDETGIFCYKVIMYDVIDGSARESTVKPIGFSFPLYVHVTNNLDTVRSDINQLQDNLNNMKTDISNKIDGISGNVTKIVGTTVLDAPNSEFDTLGYSSSEETTDSIPNSEEDDDDENNKVYEKVSQSSFDSGKTHSNDDINNKTQNTLTLSSDMSQNDNDVINNIQSTTYTLKNINFPNQLKSKKFICGYGNGKFSPDSNVNQAEMAEMIKNIVYDGRRIDYSVLNRFPNVNKSAWYAPAIAHLLQRNFNYDNTIDPEQKVTRGEFSKTLFDVLRSYADTSKTLNYGSVNINFIDIDSNEMYEAIKQLASNKIIGGYTDNTFRPNNNITRAEVVVIICNAFGRNTDANLPQKFSDVDTNHWAYKYINSSATE
jgi:hypothetical protein